MDERMGMTEEELDDRGQKVADLCEKWDKELSEFMLNKEDGVDIISAFVLGWLRDKEIALETFVEPLEFVSGLTEIKMDPSSGPAGMIGAIGKDFLKKVAAICKDADQMDRTLATIIAGWYSMGCGGCVNSFIDRVREGTKVGVAAMEEIRKRKKGMN